MFQYGEIHWTYPPLEMPLRRIRNMLNIHSDIIDKQDAEMNRYRKD